MVLWVPDLLRDGVGDVRFLVGGGGMRSLLWLVLRLRLCRLGGAD